MSPHVRPGGQVPAVSRVTSAGPGGAVPGRPLPVPRGVDPATVTRHAAQPAARRRVVVVACGATKLQVTAPAAELYTGPLFRSAFTAASRLDVEVWILSAAHGLVHPRTRLDPYELRLGDPGSVTGDVVAAQAHTEGFLDAEVVVLGGKAYVELARTVWPDASAPLAGSRGIGEMRARLARLEVWPGGDVRAPCHGGPMGNPTGDHGNDHTDTGAAGAGMVMLDEVHITTTARGGSVDAAEWEEVERVVAAALDEACRRATGELARRFPDAHITVSRSR